MLSNKYEKEYIINIIIEIYNYIPNIINKENIKLKYDIYMILSIFIICKNNTDNIIHCIYEFRKQLIFFGYNYDYYDYDLLIKIIKFVPKYKKLIHYMSILLNKNTNLGTVTYKKYTAIVLPYNKILFNNIRYNNTMEWINTIK